jgi:hypothetical protein
VWPVVVNSVSGSVEIGLELIDAVRQVVNGIELVSPGRLGALDAAVEVGSFGRQNEKLEAARVEFLLKDGSELAPTIDRMPLTSKGASVMSLSRRLLADCAEALVATLPIVHLATGS